MSSGPAVLLTVSSQSRRFLAILRLSGARIGRPVLLLDLHEAPEAVRILNVPCIWEVRQIQGLCAGGLSKEQSWLERLGS